MGRRCAVLNCNRNSNILGITRSVFQVPVDSALRKKWKDAIPNLKWSQFVCDRHFENKYIIRRYIRHDANNKVIADVAYQKPRLTPDAIPTALLTEDRLLLREVTATNETPMELDSSEHQEDGKNIAASSETIFGACKEPPVALDSKATKKLKELQNSTKKILVPNQTTLTTMVADNSSPPDRMSIPSEREKDTLKANSWDEGNTVGQSHDLSTKSPTETTDGDKSDCDHFFQSELCKMKPLLQLPKLRVVTTGSIADEKTVVTLPETWSISQTSTQLGSQITLSQIVTVLNNNTKNLIVKKYVAIESWSGCMQYYVHGKEVFFNELLVPTILAEVSTLPAILTKFERIRVCVGAGSESTYLMKGEAFEDYFHSWHHNECSLVTKNNKCEHCKKLKKILWQRKNRGVNDQTKLNDLKKKLKTHQRAKNRTKLQLRILSNAFHEKQSEIAALKMESLEEKLYKSKVPDRHKIAIKEIIAAANTANRGQRYSEDWLMQCMLMNIRSPSYYQFLRNNNIIPLPCARTIRKYYSIIDTKCGFDPNFAKLLSKHLSAKTPMQRHGVLLLDEINLRKSVTVCAKDLSYAGLSDFGPDSPKAQDIKDQATHGLTIMFQPLADSYSQPIAVFASKNPVKGDDLAKLAIKAIIYMESCGAQVHGIISDGASTNKKMATLLGVQSTLYCTKNWFTHPSDDNRRVFVFSDAPHLIKCIRNRLYQKGKLKLSAARDFIAWKYYVHLFELDSQQLGNARACPKISRRHIELDNTSKMMRVRLAVQILSDSVAKGLEFYSRYPEYSKILEGYEETAQFSKQMNDMFDALNRKQPNEGLTPDTQDFKVLMSSLEFLNDWERALQKGDISVDEFLTSETAQGLRLSLQSTMDLCRYLIDNYGFKYLLTGKLNQDNLEKFFGTVRQAAGSNDHPDCSTFLQLYKILSVYSIIKPPKAGNCTHTDTNSPKLLVTLSELKEIYGSKSSNLVERRERLKEKLDQIINTEEWEADDIYPGEHDYSLASSLDCIIYYVTGYLCKQVQRRFHSCPICSDAILKCDNNPIPESALVDLRSRGGLIHSNLKFFNLIRFVETCFAKRASSADVFDSTIDEVLSNYNFTFPCREHASEILSYAICYYIRLRMRQFTYQENQKLKKRFVPQKKLSKLANQ